LFLNDINVGIAIVIGFRNFVLYIYYYGMGAIELKEYIKMQLENADERILRIVASVFDNYSREINDDDKEILTLLEESENEYNEGKVKKSSSVINESREKYS
jgi:hypothetical protein